ncbi:MJ0042 family finger-like domain/tetratricopeptide repeat protein [Myxococcus hansupus]|uniref:MJ0042 family finger-like domain/tetratricopeptide repeat protein n=2 Tax=Pseudomyxococcus hansupus TaxID=1297742 RepID=A0A0H4X2P7_9BACT|nr:MJ0042 family finger-like domain/tetratricopeptide repeat protein [Myxococcus hansupus]
MSEPEQAAPQPDAFGFDMGTPAGAAPEEDAFAFDMSSPAEAAAAMPQSGGDVSLDAFGGYDEDPVQETRDVTRVVAIPMPTDAFREPPAPDSGYGVNEPAGTARDFDFDTTEAPAEDASQGYGVDAPAGTARDFDFSDDALPVPVEAAPPEDAFAFDIESPTGDAQAAVPEADPFALPPPAASAPMDDPFALPPQEDAFALPPHPDAYAMPSAPEDSPYAMPPPAAGAPSFDFDELPVPANGDPFALPPPAADFSDLPAPAAPQALEFADLPTPAAPAPDLSFDFNEPPAPSADPFAVDFSAPPPAADPFAADFGSVPSGDPFAVDFSAPPPAAPAPAADPFAIDFAEPTAPPVSVNPAVDFGDVDFGSPAPSPSIPDSLEFDPTARPDDDLEADLSDPLPPPPNAGPADGLEMLSFIDDAAGKESGAQAGAKVRRFHVRRRSGKVFGPFDEGVIVKMLEDGQLLGNEDVSLDSEAWSAIGTVPTFAAAIQRLMEGPAKLVTPTAAPATTVVDAPHVESASPQANMRRLEQLYEGRMAAVSVVDRSGHTEKWKKRIPAMIAAGVVVVVAGIGAATEFGTRYGAFGRRALFPARISSGTAEAKQVEEVQKALLQDTFESYKQARELSAQVLQKKEYPEVRSLWCQSVYYLQRRYAAGNPNEMTRCRQDLAEIGMLGEKDVAVIKASAAIALTGRQADTIIPTLSGAYSREDTQGDLELAFLLAEAYGQKRDEKRALDTLSKVLAKDPKSAKAHHAVGNLHQAADRADEAVAAYAAALEADPKHVASAVELAAVELLVRKDVAKGTEAVERALATDVQSALGPAELARARGLKGVALFQKHQPKEAEAELKAALEMDGKSPFLRGQLARVMRAQRNFDAALPIYEALAAEEAGNLEFADGHITALVMTGKMQDALEAVKKANGVFPNEARIAYLYGRIEDALDKLADAEGHYKRAIAADENLVEARLYLGRFYLAQRRNAEARGQLDEAVKRAPEHAGVRAGLGELALAENNALLAQQEFERSVKIDPILADAHLGLSRVALLTDDLETAKSEANRALELDPHLLKDGRLQRGLVLWRLGQLEEAVAELEKAKTEDPRSTTIPITLGAVLLERGDLPGAESNLGLALSNEPSNHEALYYLALVKAKRLEFTQAMDNMRKAVERAPNRPDYHYAYGVILRDAKNLPDAMAAWRKAVELDRNHADGHEALGHALLESSQFDEAIAAFESSLKADPRRTRVLGSIGDAYFAAARWNDAIKRYQSALKADPKLAYVYYKVARAFTEQAQHAKAIDWYRKATNLEPENPMAYYYLGFAYKERNKKREAVQAFKDYLSRKPNATDKKDIEDEIYDLQN